MKLTLKKIFQFLSPSDNINKELEDDNEKIKFDLINISIEQAKWSSCVVTPLFHQRKLSEKEIDDEISFTEDN
ncbi:11576_t:CDS:2 [Funneliformis mosseae]|uniref:11576_t:CDS:1 n=1 Tax=Funneliformis mosseae TaxID=27381 RepID=A0A9N9D467_FUNMO|nr:11576_t:CDS:2 [Funneliformis mosseae]